jgi:hypothetical protein
VSQQALLTVCKVGDAGRYYQKEEFISISSVLIGEFDHFLKVHHI